MTTEWKKHHLPPADILQMRNMQQGLCYLCGDPLPDNRQFLAVDHDHRCCPAKKSCSCCRRGLACHSCNLVIGHAKDDPQKLRRIADNLETAIAAAGKRIASKPAQLALVPASAPVPRRPRSPRPKGVLADLLKVFGTDKSMHWQVAADRLAERFPGRWDGVAREIVRAHCSALGVPTVPVRMGQKVLAGCRQADVREAFRKQALDLAG